MSLAFKSPGYWEMTKTLVAYLLKGYFICVSMCVCLCTCVTHAYVHMCVDVQRPEVDYGFLSHSSYFLRQGHSLHMEFTNLARPGRQAESSRDFPLSPSAGITDMCCHAQLFHMRAEHQTPCVYVCTLVS